MGKKQSQILSSKNTLVHKSYSQNVGEIFFYIEGEKREIATKDMIKWKGCDGDFSTQTSDDVDVDNDNKRLKRQQKQAGDI